MDDENFPDFETDEPPDLASVGKARRLAVLVELTDMGMELARLARRQAVREAEEADAALPPDGRTPRRDGMLAFSRIARVVRTCVALEERIAFGSERREEARAAAEPTPAPAKFDWRFDQRMNVMQNAFQYAAGQQYGLGGEGNKRWLRMTALVQTDEFREAMEAGPTEGNIAVALAGVAAETGITID